MRKYVTETFPCVGCPATAQRPEKHIRFGTFGRAQLNAALFPMYGYYAHMHPAERRTVWGWLTGAPKSPARRV